jgi:hypothetical protein
MNLLQAKNVLKYRVQAFTFKVHFSCIDNGTTIQVGCRTDDYFGYCNIRHLNDTNNSKVTINFSLIITQKYSNQHRIFYTEAMAPCHSA